MWPLQCLQSAERLAECSREFYPTISVITSLLTIVGGLLGFGFIATIQYLTWSSKQARLRNTELSKEIEVRRKEAEQAEAKAKDLADAYDAREQKNRDSLTDSLLKLSAAQTDAERRAVLAEQRSLELEENLKREAAGKTSSEELLRTKEALDEAQTRLSSARKLYGEEPDRFWSRAPGLRPTDFESRLRKSIPVLLIANHKGGVGKTTIAANLAASFVVKHKERVLVIDLDYQGSLTRLMLAQAGSPPSEFPSAVNELLQENTPKAWSKSAIAQAVPGLDFISCFYSFERLERSIEYAWVLGDEKLDARYRLARYVLSNIVQEVYDRVILDVPPRFTLGFINGLCCSTHVFVPTIVDATSVSAVSYFARQFNELTLINPVVKFAGIIGTRTNSGGSGTSLPSTQMPAANMAERGVQNAVGVEALGSITPLFMRDSVIQNYPTLAAATEKGIPYIQEESTRDMFDALSAEVARRTKR